MTPAKSWGLGACIGLLGLLLATLAGANVMTWHHVHRVPCKCPPAAREFLLELGDEAVDGRQGSHLFANSFDAEINR